MKRALTAALLTLAASLAAVAQEAAPSQPQPQGQSPATTQGERLEKRHRGLRRMRSRMRMRRDGLRAMRQLNLSEQQVAADARAT